MAAPVPHAYTSAFDEQAGADASGATIGSTARTYRLALLLSRPAVGAGLGVLAGGLIVLGVSLPWISTFAGLVSLSGLDALNGRVLLTLGALIVVAALVSLNGVPTVARWSVGLLGFLAVLWAGYLLINLLAEVRGADGMTLPAVGPGLPLALVGGVLALGVLFLPHEPTLVKDGATTGATGASPSAAPFRSTWPSRCAVVFATVAAVAHIPVTPDHLKEAPYIGIGFLLLTAALLLLSTGLLLSTARWLSWALLVVCLAAVAAYVVSRTLGLPMMDDDIGNWSDPLGTVSIVSETLAAVSASLVLWRSKRAYADAQAALETHRAI